MSLKEFYINKAVTESVMRYLIILALVWTGCTQAETNKAIDYLMSEPVSLFDWGVYKAGKKLDSVEVVGRFPYQGGRAWYDWGESKLVLTGIFRGNATQKDCGNHLKSLKYKLIMLEAVRLGKEADASKATINNFFSHEGGYSLERRPDGTGKGIAEITRIEAVFYNQKDELVTECSKPFLSNLIQSI
ncbi:MAG: hypothetical protein RPU91_14360 [Candidatus Sedimenticola sp. (ex Thyasira tokunagai)]